MKDIIPEKFNGCILPDGRRVPLEDAETIFDLISQHFAGRRDVLRILRGLVDECLNAGLLTGALAYLGKERLLVDDPADIAKIHLTAGIVFEKMRDYHSAVECYMEACQLPKGEKDTWYFLHNNLGYCLNQMGKYNQAEKHCRTAIEIDPRRHNAYKNLGLALQGQEIYPEAAALYLEAAFLFPPDSRSLEHLEELLADHREEVVREIPDVDGCFAALIEARQRLMQ